MFDVLMEANASEFISNKPLNANSLIGGRRPLILKTLAHLFENESASAAARSFNISHKLQKLPSLTLSDWRVPWLPGWNISGTPLGFRGRTAQGSPSNDSRPFL